MSSSARDLCRLLGLSLLSIFTIFQSASAQHPDASIAEIAQTSDLIFIGTVEAQESYYDNQETLIVTDVYFSNDEVVHSSAAAQQAEEQTIQLSYLGGEVDSVGLQVSEMPRFEVEQRYVIFTFDDGNRYINPLIGGSQGLFRVISDRATDQQYVLDAAGHAVIDVSAEEGIVTSTWAVDYVEDGQVFWQERDLGEYYFYGSPEGADSTTSATYDPPEEHLVTESPVTVDEFTAFIQDVALTTAVENPVFPNPEEEGLWYREEDGELLTEELPAPKAPAAGKTLDDSSQDVYRPGSAETGTGVSAGKAAEPTKTAAPVGQRLRACGYQNLHIVMETFDPMKQKLDNAMATWNQFMDIYRVSSDDDTYGAKNGENEFVGFLSNSDLQSEYNRGWGTALAITNYWSNKNVQCGRIHNTDVAYNRSVSWSYSLKAVANNWTVRHLRTTTMHELGHTWGHQDFINEQYNYDHPTVMLGPLPRKLMENGWGIHAVDADVLRRHYNNQTGVKQVTDVGIEAYYARNGYNRAKLEDAAGNETTRFYPGQKIQIKGMTVENMSNTAVDIDATFYLSRDRNISSSDERIGGVQWSSFGAGRYQVNNFTVKIPFSIRHETGTYYVGVRVDVPDAQEAIYANNEITLFEEVEILSPLTVSGTITDPSGHPIPEIELLGLGPQTEVKTDQNGYYEKAVPYDFSGTIEPLSAYHTFTPTKRSISGVTSSRTIDFVGTRKTATISGYVRDGMSHAMSGVTITGLPGQPVTSSSGYYEATVEQGYDYTIAAQKTGYNFTPSSKTFYRIDQDQTQDFTGREGAVANSDWPQFQQGSTHGGRLDEEPVSQAREAWTFATDAAIVTSPAIGPSETVYIGSKDERLYALTPDGTKKWTFDVNGSPTAPAIGAGEIIYVGSTDHHLYALAPSGQKKWSFDTGDIVNAAPTIGPSGTIYIGANDDSLHAVNPDGSLKWSFYAGSYIPSAAAVGPDSTIYVGSADGHIYAIRPDGTEKWRYKTGDIVRPSPTVSDRGVVYAGSDDNKLYALAPDGTLKWTFTTGGSISGSPALGLGERIYLGSTDHILYAIDSTGTELWKYSTGGAIKSSPAVHRYEVHALRYSKTEEIVYVGSQDGKIYGIQGTGGVTAPSGGTRLWEVTTGNMVLSSAALTSDALYIGSSDSKLYKLEGRRKTDGQIAVLGFDPEGNEIHIAVAQASGEGFLDPGILGGGDDGCTGGPRIIPACGDGFGTYGSLSKFVDIVAGEELRFGVVRGDGLEGVRTGEDMSGLLAEFRLTAEEDTPFFAVVSGVANPEAFTPNPDGRSTAFDLYVKEELELTAESQEQVAVFAGHFVPDGSSLELAIAETGQTFTDLRYGDMSSYISLAPAVYTLTMEMEGLQLPGKKEQVTAERTVELDLRERGGSAIALMATGFLHPEENQDGPAFALRTMSATGEAAVVSDSTGSDETDTGITRNASGVPDAYALSQNYPNPFNPSTTFEYSLPEATQVILSVFDIRGKRVATLVDDHQGAGSYAVRFDASDLPSGMYLYRLETAAFRRTGKMMLVK